MEDTFEDQIPGVFPIGWFSVVNPLDTKVALDGYNKVMEVSGRNLDSATEVQKKFKRTIEGVIECKIKIKDSRTRIAIHIPQADREYNPYDDIIIVILENDVYVVGEDNIVESDIGTTFWEQLFLVDDASWAIDEESLEDSDPLFSLLVDIWHTFKIEFNAKETFSLSIDDELIGEFSYPKYQPDYFTSLYFCVFASQYNFKFYVDNVSIRIIVAEDLIHPLNIIGFVVILTIIIIIYLLWKDNKKGVKSYRKRKIGTLIFLVFLMSFAISPALLFYNFSGSDYDFGLDIPSLRAIQEDDIFPVNGSLIYLNVPYTYAGTFFDDTNPMFAYTTAQIEFVYDPTAYSPLYYDFPVTTDFTKLEEHQPYDETNFTATEGSYRDLDNLQVDDNAYGSWNYTGIGHYRATYSFEDEIDGTSGVDIGFVDGLDGGGESVQIISSFDNHKKVLELYDNSNTDLASVRDDFDSSQTSGTMECWWGTSDNTKNSYIRFYETTNIRIIFYISAGTFRYYHGGVGWTDTGVVATNNILFHHTIVFDCGTDKFSWYINGVLEADDIPFYSASTNIDNVILRTLDVDIGYYAYYDAIGYSWDNDYMIGWNREEYAFFGDYNSTYSFDNHDIGDEGTTIDLIDTYVEDDGFANITISGGLDGHKKILHLHQRAGGSAQAYLRSDFPQVESDMTMEFWIWMWSEETWGNNLMFYLQEGLDTIIRIYFDYTDVGYIRNDDGAEIASATESLQEKWQHVRIVCDDTTNTFDFYLDGANMGTFNYKTNSAVGIDEIRMYIDYHATGSSDYYLDAIDYSWSHGYSLGRNRLTENHDLLSHYPASHSFPFDNTGEAPEGWTNVANTIVFDAWYGHRKVLQLTKDNGNPTIEKLFYTDITSGTVEFYFGSSDVSHLSHFRLNDGGSSPDIQINIKDEKIQYYDGVYVDICDAIDDNWYHIRVDFECGAGGYKGLSADTFYVYIDETQYGPYPFNDPVVHVDRIYLVSNTAAVYYFYVDAIDLSWDPDYYTGRNLIYTRANLLGQYSGTYSFESDLVYEKPYNWDDLNDVGSTSIIVSDWQGHRKVLKGTSVGGGSKYRAYQEFTSQADGNIEFWIGSTDCTNAHYLYFSKDHGLGAANLAMYIYITNDKIYARKSDGVGGTVAVDMGALLDNTWAHIYIYFDTITDTFSCWRDGILYVDNQNFVYDNTFTADELNSITVIGPDVVGAVCYYDAISYSWDDNYYVGDNIHYNNFLGSETFEGYDLTGNYDNYYGLESEWFSNGNGHYRATYSFTDELDGTTGERIGFVDGVNNPGSGSVTIISVLDEHKKVLRLEDNDGADIISITHTIADRIFGTIEFWLRIDDLVSWRWVIGDGGSTHGVVLGIAGGEFQYYDGAWHSFGAGITPLIDTWYHVQIDFECGTGGYMDLAADDFHLYWDGIKYADNDMRGTPSVMDIFQLYINTAAETGVCHIDAFGESWDNDYMIGWNREEYAFFGDYNSAYSFDDDDIGDFPSGWTDNDGASCESSVIGSLGGHKKVLQLYDNNGAGSAYVKIYFTQGLDTVIEFWVSKDSIVANTDLRSYIVEDGTTLVNLRWQEDDMDYYDGVWKSIKDGFLVANTFFHIRIVLDDTANTFDCYIDGVLEKSGLSYQSNSASGVNRVDFFTDSADLGFSGYIDAFDFSTSLGYSLGRNRLTEWNDLLGHYPATHSFQFEDVGTNGDDIDWVDAFTAGTTVEIISSLDEHRKILKITETINYQYTYSYFSSSQATGTIEFWVQVAQTNLRCMLYIYDGSIANSFMFAFHEGGNIQYYDGGFIDTGFTYAADTWYHFRIEFDCVDDWHLWINGVSIDVGLGYPYGGNPIALDGIVIRNQAATIQNFDAIGYSWDPYYYTGKNKNPIVSNLPEQYPATYSFTNELVYAEGTDIADITSSIVDTCVIVSDYIDHRKVLHFVDSDAGNIKFTAHIETFGTFEIWGFNPTANDWHIRYSDNNGAFPISIRVRHKTQIDINHGDGIGGRTIVAVAIAEDNWFHVKVQFDCGTDKQSVWINGVLEVNNENFDNDIRSDNCSYFQIYNNGVTEGYIDALGYSWDDNYYIGDNIHHKNYLGSETFENYDWTYSGHYYGTESFNYYTEPDVYYGTYDFRDELGDTDLDISWVDSMGADDTGNLAEVIATEDGHKNIIKFVTDGNNGKYAYWRQNTDSPTADGTTFEFWFKYIDNGQGNCMFYIGGIDHSTIVYMGFMATTNRFYWYYGDGGGGTIGSFVSATADTWYHLRVSFDFTADNYDVYLNEVLVGENKPFYNDLTDTGLANYRVQFDGGGGVNSLEGYIDAIGESWDTTSHSGLGYTIDYNKLSSDIEPILEGGYEIDNIHLGDSLEVVNILDAHMNVVNITGSSPNFVGGWLISPAQWGDFVFTKGAGNTVGELETDNDVNYGIIDSEFTYTDESLLGIIEPADADILTNWNEGDAAPHWSKLDEGVGGAPDGGNIRETTVGVDDKWHFSTLAIPGGRVVTKLVIYIYVKQADIIQNTVLRFTTSTGQTDVLPAPNVYSWESKTYTGLDYDQATLTAFWMNVEPYSIEAPSGWVDIECVYVEVWTSLKTYTVDYTMTWDVVDPNLISIDFLRYDYRTTVAIDCDLDIYDYDDLDWDLELESNTGVGFITGFYALTDRYISATNQVSIRFQSAGSAVDFDMELDQIALDYSNVSLDLRSLSIYDTFSQGSGTIEFWAYFADAPYVSRVLFNNDTQIFHNGSYYWRYDTTDVEIDYGIISQWVHFKIIWSGNDVDVYINGTKKIDTFWSDGDTTLSRIDFMSFSNYSFYVDAVGFSWDSDYDVNDNVNSHGKAVITALEDEGWNIVVEPYTSFGISGDYGFHRKFLNMTDDSAYTTWIIDQDFSAQTSGTVEFYYYITIDQVISFYLRDGGGSSVVRGYIRHAGNNFKVYDGAVLTTIKTPDANNEWHHVRIDFECGLGGYMGLLADTFDLYIDGVLEADDFGFNNGDLVSATEIMFSSSDQYSVDVGFYLDAVSYSWIIPQINYNTFLYGTNHTKTFTEQTSGTIEFWLDHDNYVNTSWIYLMSDFDYAYGIMVNNSYLYYYDEDWTQSSYLAGNSFSHFRFDFDCGTDTVDFYHNGTLIANGVDFFKDLSSINSIIFILNQTGDFNVWLRALGYDWDADYDIDDNINPYGKEVITALENNGWTIVEDPFTSVGVSGEFNSHKKILNITADAEGNNIDVYNSFGSSQAYGTYEFYVKMEIASDNVYLYGMRGATTTIQLRIYGDNLQAYYGAAWNDIGVIFDDNWYHIRIDFECGAGGYEGLLADTYNVYLNGTRAGPVGIDFSTVGDYLSQIRFYYTQAAVRSVYVDSIGYSWKSIYDIGDNLHCNIEAIIDFIVEMPFAEYERFILQIIAESRHYTNILTNMTFSIYNFTASSWVEISNSRSTSETLYTHNEIDLVNGLNRLFNDSGYVRFRYYGFNCSTFWLDIDLLNTTIWFPQTFEYTHTLNLLGCWRYRFVLDIGDPTEYNSTWVYFNCILPIDNFEAISESEYVTRWILTSNSTSPVLNFSDDLSGANWALYDVSEDSFYAHELIDSYLFDNTTMAPADVEDWAYGGVYVTEVEDSTPYGLGWDGTHLYMTGCDNEEVYKYDRTTGYTGVHWDTSGECINPGAICWDGTFFWVLSTASDAVYKYNAAGVYQGVSFSVAGEETAPRGITWDGTNFWITGIVSKAVYKYNAAGVYQGVSFSVAGEEANPEGLIWDGTHFWVVGTYTDEVYQYTATGVYTGVHFDVSEDALPRDITWDGTNFWISGDVSHRFNRYENVVDTFKKYQGGGYMYMQTNTTETLSLRSTDYGVIYDLSSGDYFIIDFQTTSTNQINLILLKDGVQQGSYVVSQSGNTNFNRHLVEVAIGGDIEFDQLMFTGSFEDTKYFECWDIETYEYTLTGDSADFYVDPDGIKSIFLLNDTYVLRIFEEGMKKDEVIITLNYDDLTQYVYYIVGTIECRVVLFTADGVYLPFTNFHVNLTRTLNNATSSGWMVDTIFIADIGSTYTIEVYDTFDSSVNILFSGGTGGVETYIDLYLEVYLLKIKNEALEYVDYSLYNNDTGSSITGNIFSEEIVEFNIISGIYNLSYINHEDNYPRTYNFTFTANRLITINTTYHTVYFGLFTYDGLGLNRDWVRFYINNVRKDFGRNIIQSETADLVVLDYFNNTLANETIDASAYSEYNIYVQVYSLYLLNQFTYDDLIMNITQVGSGTWMNQLIPPSSALLYRFIPNVNYTINATYINGTVYNIRTINLTDNSQTVSFGVPSKPEEYPKDVYFGIYTTTGLGIDHDLLRFYIDNNRTNFGFNTIRNEIITLNVTDFFNTTLFSQNVNTSGIYEYDILITLYSLKVKNEARVSTNYTLSYGLLETTGFILPEEIIQYQLSSNNYVFDYTNNEDGTSDTININLNQDRVYILNSTYYTTYFSLYDQNGVRLDDSLFSLYLNTTRRDFGFVELSSADVLIVVHDYLNFTAFNSIITLSGSTEYNIIITVFELQIRHLGRDNSNLTLYETTTHNHIDFSMSPDSLNKYILSNSIYNVTWINGENGISTIYDINLFENYILTLNSTYYNIYFSLHDLNSHIIFLDQYAFRLNGTIKDFGLIEDLQTDRYTVNVVDRFNTTLFNNIITLRGLNEYRIDITLHELQIRHLARENSNLSLYETTAHNSLNFSMAPDTITSLILADSTYNITWTNGENNVATVYYITLNSDYILTLNTSYYDILFSLNDLRLNIFDPTQYEFKLNGTPQILGLIRDLQTDDYTIVIIDRFGLYLFNTIVTLRGLNEYMINISLYELQIRHLARENSDLILTEDISGTTYSFIMTPDSIKSIIVGTADYTLSWTNGENGLTTLISIALTADRVIMLNTSYYNIYFSLYDLNLHIIDSNQYEFRLNNTIEDLGLIEDLQTDNYNITITDRFGTSLFNNIVTLRGLNEYRINISLYELQIRHLAYENSNVSLIDDVLGANYSFIMMPDSYKSIIIGNSNYTLNWTNGENGILTQFPINLTQDTVIKLNTSYFEVYFGLFTYDFLGVDRDFVRFYVNGDRKDFNEVLLTQDSNVLLVTDYFGQTLYSATMNLRPYKDGEWNIYVTIYTLYLFNNYSHPIDIVIERNDVEIRFGLAPQMFTQYRFVPDVEYEIKWYYENGTKIDDMELEFEDNGQIVSFGFFETEVPYDPADLVVNTWTIVAFVIIICIICVIIVIAWAYMKKEKDVVPKKTRNLYKNKPQWKPGTFKDNEI